MKQVFDALLYGLVTGGRIRLAVALGGADLVGTLPQPFARRPERITQYGR